MAGKLDARGVWGREGALPGASASDVGPASGARPADVFHGVGLVRDRFSFEVGDGLASSM